MQANTAAAGAADVTPLYDPDRGRKVCDRVATGATLQAACRGGDPPELQRVMRWLFFDEVPDFTTQYLAARSARLELMLDEVVAIADALSEPVPALPLPAQGKTGDKNEPAAAPLPPEKERLAIAKLRIDARRWLIERQLKPTSGPDTSTTGRLVPSEILRDGVSS